MARKTKQATPGRLTSVADIRTFVTAGNARLTLVSGKTGTRFTFRVRKNDEANSVVSHFVQVLTGTDNDSDDSYRYLGHIYNEQAGLRYVHGRKSKIGQDAPSAVAWMWFWNYVIIRGCLPSPAQCEVWHEGKCCRCLHPLTVPRSIANGVGPECAKIMGLAA